MPSSPPSPFAFRYSMKRSLRTLIKIGSSNPAFHSRRAPLSLSLNLSGLYLAFPEFPPPPFLFPPNHSDRLSKFSSGFSDFPIPRHDFRPSFVANLKTFVSCGELTEQFASTRFLIGVFWASMHFFHFALACSENSPCSLSHKGDHGTFMHTSFPPSVSTKQFSSLGCICPF